MRPANETRFDFTRLGMMKLPARKSTFFLAIFLIGHGALPLLELDKVGTLVALTNVAAIAAGVFFWMEK